jgi:mono/diheme cytochrome c family protein
MTVRRICVANFNKGLRVAFMATTAVAFFTVAFAQNLEQVKFGMSTWKSAGCVDCHGKFADGNPDDDDFPIGANLRTTRLGIIAIRETINCGRAGTGMPSFDEGAYIERPCYGRPLGLRPDNLQPTPRALTAEEIDDVIAYLQARVIGRGRITFDECLAYSDDRSEECEDYK